MLEVFMAKVGGKVISWLITFGIIAALITALVITYLLWQGSKKDVLLAEKDLAVATEANQTNQSTIRHLHRNEQIANEITAKEIAKSSQREKSLAAIKKELKNVKGSEELMGPYFDDLADRLRALEQSPSDSTN